MNAPKSLRIGSGVNSEWRSRAQQCARQSPLLRTSLTLTGLRHLRGEQPPGAVFVGIGLCGRSTLSQGLPIDVLGLLLAAEQLRAASGIPRLLVLIADAHANAAGFSTALVDQRARATVDVLESLSRFLPALRVLSAHDLHRTSSYVEARKSASLRLDSHVRGYAKSQVADLLTLADLYNRVVKVGWAMPEEQVRGDERHFDQLATPLTHGRAAFAYTRSGVTLSGRRRHVPPYIVYDRGHRICLDSGEEEGAKLVDAQRRLSKADLRCATNHLRRIAYVFNRRCAPLRGDLLTRVEQMREHCRAGAEEHRGVVRRVG